ncbi:MAG: hypothetical protein KDC28_00700 [Saprospiraceae bacterium]|nr:hypothetical protein [Saprospiraceae bacterium]
MHVTVHRIYIWAMAIAVMAAIVLLSIQGFDYYRTPLEERFFQPQHEVLKPSGLWGHGLGIIGTLLILIGVFSYMARKRIKKLARLGLQKHWLEFHIFLCTIGPVMVLFHTAFKFGGIVAISFWSMVAVVLSGVLGRFIYNQIPRTLQGRELSLQEVQAMRDSIANQLKEVLHQNEPEVEVVMDSIQDHTAQANSKVPWTRMLQERNSIHSIKSMIPMDQISRKQRKEIIRLVRHEMTLNRRIDRLVTMQKLFRYWHVAHMPFALVMLVIMILHVAITLTFGYTWIFK